MKSRRQRQYPTFYVSIGNECYTVPCRVDLFRAAPHVGADSPYFLNPGSPLRVRVLRIPRDRIDVTEELFTMTRSKIDRAVYREAAARFGPRTATGPELSSTSFSPALSFQSRDDRALAIGRRILDARDREARDERDQLLLQGEVS